MKYTGETLDGVKQCFEEILLIDDLSDKIPVS